MAGKILKKEEVLIADSASVGGGRCGQPSPASYKSSVKITEQNGEYMILEFVCSCGRKSHLKCLYSKNEGSAMENKS